MMYAGDEYYDDDITSGLSTMDPWHAQTPIDEAGEDEELDEAEDDLTETTR